MNCSPGWGKGQAKATRAPGQKGGKGKGGYQGNCLHCGAWGHCLNECRKKDADMKGKGKGQGPKSDLGWSPQNPSKGKG